MNNEHISIIAILTDFNTFLMIRIVCISNQIIYIIISQPMKTSGLFINNWTTGCFASVDNWSKRSLAVTSKCESDTYLTTNDTEELLLLINTCITLDI